MVNVRKDFERLRTSMAWIKQTVKTESLSDTGRQHPFILLKPITKAHVKRMNN